MAAVPPYAITPVVQPPQPAAPPWGRLVGLTPPLSPGQLTASVQALGVLSARITAPY